MSDSEAQAIAAEAAYVVKESTIQNYSMIAIAVLIVYDYALTFNEEVRLVWGSKASSSIMFYLNRCTLIGIALSTIFTVELENTLPRCSGFNITYVIFGLSSIIICAVVSALRVHAVSGQKWYLSTLTFALGMVPVGTNVYQQTIISYIMFPLPESPACVGESAISIETANRFATITRACGLASDSIVLAVTWYYMYDVAQMSPPTLGSKPRLTRLLLKDGTFYFITIAFLDIFDLLDYWLFSHYFETSYFLVVVTSILVSRFLLDVRGTVLSTHGQFGPEELSFVRSMDILRTRTHVSTIAFASDSSVNMTVPHQRRTNSSVIFGGKVPNSPDFENCEEMGREIMEEQELAVLSGHSELVRSSIGDRHEV